MHVVVLTGCRKYPRLQPAAEYPQVPNGPAEGELRSCVRSYRCVCVCVPRWLETTHDLERGDIEIPDSDTPLHPPARCVNLK